jgi:hypothetical protein
MLRTISDVATSVLITKPVQMTSRAFLALQRR